MSLADRFPLPSRVLPALCSALLLAGVARAEPPYQLYFGDLHTHTAYSDGVGTPWEAYAAAIAAGADFMAVSDHDGYGFWLSQEEWEDTRAAAEHYTSRYFVAIPAYEFWLAGSGEINVFDAPDLPPLPEDPDPHPSPGGRGDPDEVLPAFYDWLATQPGASGQWNHPTYVSNEFRQFDGWTAERDRAMNLVEVWNDSWFYTEESYQKALDAGWHVMPAANADNHTDEWISGLPLRTVLLARRLTPDALYEAMRARRGYATVDPNLRVGYTLNGAVMGSVLAPAASYQANIRVEEPDGIPVTRIEIVSDGGELAASLECDSPVVEWSPTLVSATRRYYYVRITTESNEASVLAGPGDVTAVTAPVWTGR